jgi:hypothetical protein
MIVGGRGGEIRGLSMRGLAVRIGPLAAILALLALGDCSTNIEPTQADLRANWEAHNIDPRNYRADLVAYLRTYLNDPTHIRGASLSPPLRTTVGPGERFVSCVRYDARNSDGKYIGSKDNAVIYVSGKLDRYVDGVTKEGAKRVKELCNDAVYAPFPELERLTR